MRLLIIFLATAALAGCATLVNGNTQQLNVRTDPPGAECAVGIFKIVTPGVVQVRRNALPLILRCRLAGYEMAEQRLFLDEDFPLKVGNIFFGLIPGLFVDSITGAANRVEPDIVDLKLQPLAAAAAPGYTAPPR